MRLVCDTNVLVAALIARGVCADLLEHCVANHSLITSDFILDELHEQLIGKFKRNPNDVDEAIALFRSTMTVVEPVLISPSVCRDPDDDWILATAVAGQAGCIITGDKDLLVLQNYTGISILAPSDFADFEVANM
jgi:putative PIN family toxin of toxin-antitoxin system